MPWLGPLTGVTVRVPASFASTPAATGTVRVMPTGVEYASSAPVGVTVIVTVPVRLVVPSPAV